MINGKNLNIKLGGKILAKSKSCSCSMQAEGVETVAQFWRNRAYTDGKVGWRLTASGLASADFSLLTYGSRLLQLSFNLPDGNIAQGEGFITNIDLQADNGKLSTYSVTIQGSGGLHSEGHSGFDYTFDFIFD